MTAKQVLWIAFVMQPSRLQTSASEGTRGQGFCFGWQIFFGEQTPLTIKRAPGPSHGNGITQLATSAATPPLGEAVGPTTRGILPLMRAFP